AAGDLVRQARHHRDVPPDVEALRALREAGAEDDVVDLFRSELPDLREHGLHGVRGHVVRTRLVERPSERLREPGPLALDDDGITDLTHGRLLLSGGFAAAGAGRTRNDSQGVGEDARDAGAAVRLFAVRLE